jgi:hypothetical protein
MRAKGIALLMVVGVAFGFFSTLVLLPERNSEGWLDAAVAPVNLAVNFSFPNTPPASFGTGWEKPEQWGVWSKGNEAIVLAQLRGKAGGDVILFVEGRGKPSLRGEKARVTVSANGSQVGVWQLNGSERESASFIVAREIANKESPLRIAFRSELPLFGVSRILLRDVSSLSEFAGYIDSCQGTRLSGWAKTGTLLAPIVIRRGGRVVTPVAFQNVNRPDLPANGLPAVAGFDITLPPSRDSPQETDVRFPNGKPLDNSPCRMS